MGLLGRLTEPMSALPPDDDFWYGGAAEGAATTSGLRINNENALHISAMFAGMRVISEDVASLPLSVFERIDSPDTRLRAARQAAPDHDLWPLLHDQPNEWQSSFEWREMSGFHVLLRGNAYSHTPFDRSGEIQELRPLNPARMEVRQIPSSGRLRYDYTDQNGQLIKYTQDEILHVRAQSIDGIVGLSIPGIARNSLGLTVAAEEYGARSFANDPHLAGVLQHPKNLSKGASKRIALSFRDGHSGSRDAWTPAVLEEGMTWQSVGVTSKDAQFLETRRYQLREVARWLRVKPHKLGDLEDATFSNIEHEGIEYVTDTIRPWAIRWEQALMRWGFTRAERRRFLIEHNLEGLLRGDTESRFKAYQVAILTGWMDRNEVRTLENLNPRAGLDTLLVPLNTVPAAAVPGAGDQPSALNDWLRQTNGPAAPPVLATDGGGQQLQIGPGGQLMLTSSAEERARPIVENMAEGIVRREIAAVTRAASKHADSPAAFLEDVEQFYAAHYEHVLHSLQLRPREAQAYVAAQRAAVSEHGVTVLEQWQAERVPELVTLAIGAAA